MRSDRADERPESAERSASAATAASPASKWVNAGPDEGALHALLERIAERVPPARIDVVWIFPPRIAGGIESTVIVIAGFAPEPERRTVATAHFRVTRDRRGRATVDLQMQEHGSAPVGATQRVVDGVLRRLGDEVGREAPRRVEIAGDAASWWALFQDVGGAPPEEALARLQTAATPQPDDDTVAAAAAEQHAAPALDDRAGTPPHGDVLADGIGAEPVRGEDDDDGAGTPPHGDVLADAIGRERAADEDDAPGTH